MDLLNSMRVFVRVVDCASFTAAAQLKDRFEVVSARTSLPSPIENASASAEKRVNPELLIAHQHFAGKLEQDAFVGWLRHGLWHRSRRVFGALYARRQDAKV